jgi:UDP-galactopyranose mutase
VMIEESKVLIVGAGFSGAVIARELAEAGINVDIVDKRNHIGGNSYDYIHADTGIRIHKYGPHIFHTNNEKVFNWLSKFTDWTEYKHEVRAMLNDGREVVLPPNRETQRILGKENIVDILFKPYTKKMWGMELEELDPAIIKRVPVRDDDNKLYFPNDKFQCLPKDGYHSLFESILDHERISVHLGVDFKRELEEKYLHIFNSMPIDEYYGYIHGELPYRSIIFSHQVINIPSVLSLPTINFTNDGKYTRVTEWKNYPNHGENEYKTILTYEEPVDYKDNNEERFYPVKDLDGANRKLYEKYKKIPNEKITFIGRCGMYVYIDMHQAVSSALKVAKDYIEGLSE